MKVEGDWKALEAHASTKKFFKGNYKGEPALLICFEGGSEEKDRFANITAFLLSRGIPVPEIIHNPDEPCIITRFIDGRLFSKIHQPADHFERIINSALLFRRIDLSGMPEEFKVNRLDLDRLKYEMDFFFLHFCESFLNEKPDERLRQAIFSLAEEVSRFPAAFAHRDYHSENIIILRDSLFIVDYQDALPAPRAYDLASLYVDGYREPKDREKSRILEFAEAELDISHSELRKTALQRAVKALGTFGYQVVHRKKAKYFESMIRTSKYIWELAGDETLADPSAVDYLRSIKAKLT
jgi:N-acetylmuramate 1-kinase